MIKASEIIAYYELLNKESIIGWLNEDEQVEKEAYEYVLFDEMVKFCKYFTEKMEITTEEDKEIRKFYKNKLEQISRISNITACINILLQAYHVSNYAHFLIKDDIGIIRDKSDGKWYSYNALLTDLTNYGYPKNSDFGKYKTWF